MTNLPFLPPFHLAIWYFCTEESCLVSRQSSQNGHEYHCRIGSAEVINNGTFMKSNGDRLWVVGSVCACVQLVLGPRNKKEIDMLVSEQVCVISLHKQ